jgi:hypothetical protein
VIYIENDDVFESIDDNAGSNEIQRINSDSNQSNLSQNPVFGDTGDHTFAKMNNSNAGVD